MSGDPGRLYDVEVIAKYVQKDTNVEIHPAARIGAPFAVDHGHGTVIGATTVIGSRTFIYHGVTLGVSKKRSKTQRRHPLIGNDVFLGNGSQILGPCLVQDRVRLASSVLVRDCLLETDVSLAMGIRAAGVQVPKGTRILAADPENLRRYFVLNSELKRPAWLEFAAFDPESVD